ncbi:glycosyl hydrolase family 95 catalytic domain-containing protein [Mariniphaga sediminis]|uniref:glycosyl hydrolase family 95 catalytic domain-containing protein n=1 Tax=Mariniphaga sediminis TaxID=1628158 RepID=UPI0035671782
MNKLIIITAIVLMSCSHETKKSSTEYTPDSENLIEILDESGSRGYSPGDLIWSNEPASEWAEGYPIGNGRIGGMVLGETYHERIALNHDLLWRQFWSYQKHNTSGDIAKIRDFCLEGKWDEAEAITLKKIAATGKPIYVNPYVPVGDMYIDLRNSGGNVTDYTRRLNMDKGIVEVSYCSGGIKFKKEAFCPWGQGVMVTHLSADKAAALTGEVSLSRLPDPECRVTGYSELDKVIMEGQFEEGRKFAVVTKIVQRGGRLTSGKKEYRQAGVEMPEKSFGLKYIYRKNETSENNKGASTFFDSADEVLILTAITVDDEVGNGASLVEKCYEKLENINTNYDVIKEGHIADHQELYRQVSLRLGAKEPKVPTDSLLRESINGNTASPALLEKMFNMARYLAICSGRPQPEGQPSKAPINLQGIWNQDRRPAWDCDYHLDLNVEMCYWPLDMVNLGELMEPLMDWVEKLIPQGRIAAKDLYGCDGVFFPTACDYNNIGNVCNVGFYWPGGAAWVAQLLWQHWEYSCDQKFLKERLYPFMFEIGEFYEDFLFEGEEGFLIPSLSTSPEMPIAGRENHSFLSSASTMDLELIRELFTHLLEAGNFLKVEKGVLNKWAGILEKVPFPKIHDDGYLTEWLEDHIPGDPGHRHRSQFVGLSPGDRISFENTPNYAEAAYLALKKRHDYGVKMTQSLTYVWDAQILARLYRGDEAYGQLKSMLPIHMLDNLLITCNDWGGKGGLAWFEGVKLFQVEANIGLASSIIEMIFQDRQHLLRFLPALPSALPNGEVKGLRARGGFEVGLKWEEGKLISSRIISLTGNLCRVKDNGFDKVRITSDGEEVEYSHNKDKGIISFDTQKGKEYQLTFSENTITKSN